MSLQIPHLGLMLLRNLLCRNTRRNGWLDESNAKTFNEIKALFGSNNGFDHGAYLGLYWMVGISCLPLITHHPRIFINIFIQCSELQTPLAKMIKEFSGGTSR